MVTSNLDECKLQPDALEIGKLYCSWLNWVVWLEPFALSRTYIDTMSAGTVFLVLSSSRLDNDSRCIVLEILTAAAVPTHGYILPYISSTHTFTPARFAG